MTRAIRERFRSTRTRGLVVALAFGFALAPAPSQAVGVVDVAAGAFDVAILRPLNFVALAVGTGFFVVGSPLIAVHAATSEGTFAEGFEPSWEAFVYGPVDYTFLRPIGDF